MNAFALLLAGARGAVYQIVDHLSQRAEGYRVALLALAAQNECAALERMAGELLHQARLAAAALALHLKHRAFSSHRLAADFAHAIEVVGAPHQRNLLSEA